MERIRIPNRATYSPLPLLDVAMLAPLASRVLFRSTLPGKALQLATMGYYATSAAQDWLERRGVRRIDFLAEFGADVHHLEEMPETERRDEIRRLTLQANDAYTPERLPRSEAARLADEKLTAFIASITGQRVETSTEVRDFTVAKIVFPFALGACDFISGDIAIFRETGVFEPHVITHEFAHRKGYWKELEAQALAYLALAGSGHRILEQSARCERIHRHMRVLASDDLDRFSALIEESGLREELAADFRRLRSRPGPAQQRIEAVLKRIYEERMRLTGQNGLDDYDRGFTNFLYTVEKQRSQPEGANSRDHADGTMSGRSDPA